MENQEVTHLAKLPRAVVSLLGNSKLTQARKRHQSACECCCVHCQVHKMGSSHPLGLSTVSHGRTAIVPLGGASVQWEDLKCLSGCVQIQRSRSSAQTFNFSLHIISC